MSPRLTAIIEVQAKDRASGVLRGIATQLGEVGRIALGMLAARGLEAGINMIGNMTRGLAELSGNYQLAQVGLAAMLAAQERFNQAAWEEVRVGVKRTQLTEDQRKKLRKLRGEVQLNEAALNLLNARIQEQTQRVWEMENKWTAQGLAYKTAVARLRKMQVQAGLLNEKIAEQRAEIARLESMEGREVPVIRRNLKWTLTWAEAKGLTAERAEVLWKMMQALATTRGVPMDVIAGFFRYALGAGMSVDTLEKLIPLTVDWGVATGKSTYEIKSVVRAMTDMQARGKLAFQEILQYANANVPVLSILAKKLGVTRAEVQDLVEKGAVPASLVFEALEEFFTGFSDAADDMATTLPVAARSLRELTRIGLAEFFMPIADQIGSLIRYIVDLGKELGVFDQMRELGAQIADSLAPVFDRIKELITVFAQLATEGDLAAAALAVLSEIIPEDTLDLLITLFERLRQTFQDIGTFIQESVLPAFSGLSEAMPKLSQVLQSINENWAGFDAAIKATFGFLVAVGAVALITSLAGAFLSLLNPITLAAAAIGALAFAWVQFGDQIQAIAVGVFQNILGAVMTWLQGPIETFRNIWGDLVTVGQANMAIWQSVANTFMEVFWPAIQAGVDLLARFWDLGWEIALLLVELGKLFAAAGQALKDWALGKLISWLKQTNSESKTLSEIVRGLSDLIERVKVAWDWYKEALQGVVEATKWVTGQIEKLSDRIGDLRRWLEKFRLGAFEPGSPSPFEVSVRGVADAFRELRMAVRGMELAPAYALAAPEGGPTYNVVVNISGGTPEAAREAAYEGVLLAFEELAAQLVI